MPKLVPPLTEIQIAAFVPGAKQYKRSDGKRLYLVVEPTGIKRLHFSVDRNGKSTTFSFGIFPEVSLAEARMRREEISQLIEAGINPVMQRKEQKKLNNAIAARKRLLHLSMNSEGEMIIENKNSRINLSGTQVTALKAFLIATNDQPNECINA